MPPLPALPATGPAARAAIRAARGATRRVPAGLPLSKPPPRAPRRHLAARSQRSDTGAGAGAGAPAGGDSWIVRDTVSARPDVIVMLAGGQNADGSNPPWVERRSAAPARPRAPRRAPRRPPPLPARRVPPGPPAPARARRLDACAELHRRHGSPIVCSGGGTPHRPPVLNAHGYVTTESAAGARYLLAAGVDARSVLRESASMDTVGNGYFTLTAHCLPRRWTRLCVVTSQFHMPRSAAIFRTLARLAEADGHGPFRVDLVEVSDEGMFEDEVLEARRAREARSLARWEADTRGLAGLAAFAQWLHETHLCYAVPRQHELGVPTALDDLALKSY